MSKFSGIRLAICVMILASAAAAQDEHQRVLESLAFLELQNRGGVSDGFTDRLSLRIRGEISRYRDLKLLEQETVTTTLSDAGFHPAQTCTEEACLIQVGEILAVDRTVGGSVGRINGVTMIRLKYMDIESGKTIAQVSREHSGSNRKLMTQFIPELVTSLIGSVDHSGDPYAKLAKPPRRRRKEKLVRRPQFWVASGALAATAGAAVFLFSNPDDEETTNPDYYVNETLPMPTLPEHPVVE